MGRVSFQNLALSLRHDLRSDTTSREPVVSCDGAECICTEASSVPTKDNFHTCQDHLTTLDLE